MSRTFLEFHHVSFSYTGAAEDLLHDATFHLACGWTGIAGPNGSGKTTLLKLACRLLEPETGSIDAPWDALYCPQRTDEPVDELVELLSSTDKEAAVTRNRLGVADDWPERWETLSHGERKRAQLAVALWRQPLVLAVDEPTNHLDSEARRMIADALASFKGIGLLVSHDRELLDSLCYQCVFLEPPEPVIRRGGYTKGMQVAAEEQKTLENQRLQHKRSMKKLRKEMNRRSEEARKSKKRVSKRGLAAKDHDARSKRDLARLTGKDGVAGKLKRQMENRLNRTQENIESVKTKKEYNLGIHFRQSVSHRDFLLDLPAGSIQLSVEKELHHPHLVVGPADRIGIKGPNGTGKSTLIRHLVERLNVPKGHVTYVPQEIHARVSQELLEDVRRLSGEQLGQLMTIISRLGSRPKRLLSSRNPSPGETRKLLLALGITNEPHIIIMDEPTNHMDLPSIECLESALAEVPCALVLVSHDERFTGALTGTQWQMVREIENTGTWQLTID